MTNAYQQLSGKASDLSRKFLFTTLVTMPWASRVLTVATNTVSASFWVKVGKGRFNHPLLLKGVNANLVQVSAQDQRASCSCLSILGEKSRARPWKLALLLLSSTVISLNSLSNFLLCCDIRLSYSFSLNFLSTQV
jgi:hypothetical protein